jgi:hypothetical protein
VDVVLRPYHWPEIGVVYRGEEYLARPIVFDSAGFPSSAAVIGEEFKAVPESITQTGKKQADNFAYGEERKKDAVPFAGITVFGHQSDKVNINYMPRRGTPHHVTAGQVDERRMSVMQFFKKLRIAGVIMTPEINRLVRDTFGDTIAAGDADRIIDAVIDGMPVDMAIPNQPNNEKQIVNS